MQYVNVGNSLLLADHLQILEDEEIEADLAEAMVATRAAEAIEEEEGEDVITEVAAEAVAVQEGEEDAAEDRISRVLSRSRPTSFLPRYWKASTFICTQPMPGTGTVQPWIAVTGEVTYSMKLFSTIC